jgi:hypothetical protein
MKDLTPHHTDETFLKITIRMETYDLKLLEKGWQKPDSNPFQERVSQSADFYFSYLSTIGQNLGICIFNEKKLLKFRVSDPQNQDVRWFQSEFEDKLETLIQEIIEYQNQVSIRDYFGLYLKLSGICKTSILAWEQWESNYR